MLLFCFSPTRGSSGEAVNAALQVEAENPFGDNDLKINRSGPPSVGTYPSFYSSSECPNRLLVTFDRSLAFIFHSWRPKVTNISANLETYWLQ